MNASISSPSVLLQHDGELSDIARLLAELDAHYCECIGPFIKPEGCDGFDIVFATPRRILSFEPERNTSSTTLIAVLEGDSKTLRSQLRRISVDLMIRRPVHPTALRLLMLHTLYRGPERRNRKRVSIGAQVRFKTGLLPRSALLADFSTRGCRLLTRAPLARDTSINLSLPGRITGHGKLKISGSVIRSGPAIGEEGGFYFAAVRFRDLSAGTLDRLHAILDLHSSGPAMLAKSEARKSEGSHSAKSGPEAPVVSEMHPEADPAREEHANVAPDRESDAAEAAADRRTGDRHPFERRIVALGEQATRVLLGRDISMGGMRVDAASGLVVDESVQIAVHADTLDEPLVLQARVLRDDGQEGLVLRFEGLNDDRAKDLSELITHLPVQSPYGEEADSGIVISEIIERESA